MSALLAAIDPLTGGILAAGVAALGAYFAAARRFSGKIGTSDAADLWAESRSIRDWSQARITALDMEVAVLRTRVGIVETQNEALSRENSALMKQITDLNTTIAELRAEIVTLTSGLRRSYERVQELEEEAK